MTQNLDELCINTIRFLAVDAVEKANSGTPRRPYGHGPPWLTPSGIIRSSTTPVTPIGPTATASYYPRVTPPCCYTPCCT